MIMKILVILPYWKKKEKNLLTVSIVLLMSKKMGIFKTIKHVHFGKKPTHNKTLLEYVESSVI